MGGVGGIDRWGRSAGQLPELQVDPSQPLQKEELAGVSPPDGVPTSRRGIKEAWRLVEQPPHSHIRSARHSTAGHRCHRLIAGRSEGISAAALLKYVPD